MESEIEDIDVRNVSPEDWPHAEKQLSELTRLATARCVEAYGQLGYEADSRTNSLSRAIVVAMKREKGAAFLYKINLHGKERGIRENICQEWTGQMVYNFGWSVVAPVRDETVIDLICSRDAAEYTGTKDDTARIDAIFKRLEGISAIYLHWQ